jgi:microtubule-associated protein-like 6
VLLFKDRIGPDIITDLKWKNDTEFVSVGINHFRLWTLQVGGLASKRGVLSKNNSNKYLVVNFNNDDCLVGASDGSLQIFKGNTWANSIAVHDNGKPLEAISVTKELYQHNLLIISILTGAKDGKVNLLDTKGTYKVLLTIKVLDLIKGALSPEIKTVALSPDLKSILIGTAGGEIYELTTKVIFQIKLLGRKNHA